MDKDKSSTQQQQQQQQQSGQPGSSQTSSSSISNLHSLIGYSNPPAPPGTNRPRPEAVHQDTNGGKHAEVAGILQQHMRPMGDRIPTDSQASHIGHNELAPGPVGSRPPRPANGGTSGTSGNGAGAGAGASAGVGAGSASVGGTGAVGSTGTAGGSQGSS
ncbi:hypothetical protein GQ42DRAFT_159070 [Ramicandelaber brevisporus]|nr:hypothetical protein GQ42DRAFT_159070 [Ramicandelaber brevisporus]